MSSVWKWAAGLAVAALILLGPIVAFLVVNSAEILIGSGVERVECHAQLLALPRRDQAQRWPVEDDVAAFASGVDFNAKPV